MKRTKKPPHERQKSQSKQQQRQPKEDIFAEDIQYEIETSSRKITDSRIDNGTGENQSYIERLETKIQEQAKRLSDLENYKYLAEKRGKQLSPNEAFPLSEPSSSLKGDNKYDSLYSKYVKLQNDFNDLASRKAGEGSNKNTLGSNLSSDSNCSNKTTTQATLKRLKDAYSHLKQKYKGVKEEKKEALDQLRQETLQVEEQRNIIAILKQTLDSEFVKAGVLNKNMTAGTLIDYTQMKSESEQYRKQLVLSQALVNSLKSEIEDMIKDKDQREKENKEIEETNRGLIEKVSNTERELNSKVKQYQADMSSMKGELEMLNNRLYEEVNSNESRYPPSTTKRETDRNMNSNPQRVNTILDLKSKMEELLSSYHRLNSEHANTLKDITTLKEEKTQLLSQIELLNQNRQETEQSIEEAHQMKELLELQQKQIESLTKKNSELDTLIEEADNKLSDNYTLNKDVNLKIVSLESEIKRKNEQLSLFNDLESKVNYYNQYVSSIKTAFKLLINQSLQYIDQYNSMANENLNSLLTKNFSQAITLLINQIKNLPQINQYTLDASDAAITKAISTLLQIITEEFKTIYSKLFESNDYFKESHMKVGLLEGQLRQETNSLKRENAALQKQIQADILRNEESKRQLSQFKKDLETKDKCIISQEAQIHKMKLQLNEVNSKSNSTLNDKMRYQNMLHLLIKHIPSKDIQKSIQEFQSMHDMIVKLSIEQTHVEEKLASMEEEYDKMVRIHGIDSSNKELIDTVNKEQRTLKELAHEFQHKIAEKEKRLNEILSFIENSGGNSVFNPNQRLNLNRLEINTLDSNAFNTINQEGGNYTARKALNGINYSNEQQLTDYDDFEMDTLKGKNSTADMTNASGNKITKDGKYTYEMNKSLH